jgi:hypothetical protein
VDGRPGGEYDLAAELHRCPTRVLADSAPRSDCGSLAALAGATIMVPCSKPKRSTATWSTTEKARDIVTNGAALRAPYLLFPAIGFLATCSAPNRRLSTSLLPQAFDSTSHSACYNGVGFFRVPKADLQRRLPGGFVARDGSLLGREHAGYGLVALAYYDCQRRGGDEDRFAVIATPVENPSFAQDLRPVRWSWYEFGRVADNRERVEIARERGFSVQIATLSHPPFHEGDRQSSFTAVVNGKPLFEVRAALTDSVNFQAQSHRFWHRRRDGRVVSTRFDFGYHHSWVGRFDGCTFHGEALGIPELSSIECTGIGVTEAIERLPMTEQVIRWR